MVRIGNPVCVAASKIMADEAAEPPTNTAPRNLLPTTTPAIAFTEAVIRSDVITVFS